MAILAVGVGILAGILTLVPGGVRFYAIVVRHKRCGLFGTLALMIVPFCAVLCSLWCVWTVDRDVFILYASGVVAAFIVGCIIGLVVSYPTFGETRQR